LQNVVEKRLESADASVSFPAAKGRTWRLQFKAGESKIVVIRGLRFFLGEREAFPSLVPPQT
jgi:hypothetical protein